MICRLCAPPLRGLTLTTATGIRVVNGAFLKAVTALNYGLKSERMEQMCYLKDAQI